MNGAVRSALAGAMILLASAAARAALPACPAIDDDGSDSTALSHVAAVLHPGGTLPVLAVGSATVFGPQVTVSPDAAHPRHAASPPAAVSQTGFPWQMAHALEAAITGLHVPVTVIGGRGLSADIMLARMRAELTRHQYRLVIWQTGTVEAADLAPPDAFYATLTDGAAAAAAAGADLVLVDPQWSRFLEANANLAPYLSAMQAASALPGVVLFHRYDIMRGWAESAAIDLEETPKQDRTAAAVRLHACLGRALARMLTADAAIAKE